MVFSSYFFYKLTLVSRWKRNLIPYMNLKTFCDGDGDGDSIDSYTIISRKSHVEDNCIKFRHIRV